MVVRRARSWWRQGDQGVRVHVRCSSGSSLEGDVYVDGAWEGRGSDVAAPTDPGTHAAKVVTDYGTDQKSVTVHSGQWTDVYFYFDCPTGPVCMEASVTGDLVKGGGGTLWFKYCVEPEDLCGACRQQVESTSWVMRVADAGGRIVAEGQGRFYGHETRTYEGLTLRYKVYGLYFPIAYSSAAGDWLGVVYPWLTRSFSVSPAPSSAYADAWNVSSHAYSRHWARNRDEATYGKYRASLDRTPAGGGASTTVGSDYVDPWYGPFYRANSWDEEAPYDAVYRAQTIILAWSEEVPDWRDSREVADEVYVKAGGGGG